MCIHILEMRISFLRIIFSNKENDILKSRKVINNFICFYIANVLVSTWVCCAYCINVFDYSFYRTLFQRQDVLKMISKFITLQNMALQTYDYFCREEKRKRLYHKISNPLKRVKRLLKLKETTLQRSTPLLYKPSLEYLLYKALSFILTFLLFLD